MFPRDCPLRCGRCSRCVFRTGRQEGIAARRWQPIVNAKGKKEVRHAASSRQPVDDVQRGTVPRPLRRRPAGRVRGRGVSVSLRFSRHRTARTPQRRGPDPGPVQHAAGRLGGRRARHGQHPRPSDGIPRVGQESAGLRNGVGLPAGALHGRDCARGCVADDRGGGLCREPRLGDRTGQPGRRKAGDRADQSSRHAGLFLEHPGAGGCDRRGDRTRPAGAAVRRLPCADHRGRHHQAHGAVHAGDRAYADRRRAGAQ